MNLNVANFLAKHIEMFSSGIDNIFRIWHFIPGKFDNIPLLNCRFSLMIRSFLKFVFDSFLLFKYKVYEIIYIISKRILNIALPVCISKYVMRNKFVLIHLKTKVYSLRWKFHSLTECQIHQYNSKSIYYFILPFFVSLTGTICN